MPSDVRITHDHNSIYCNGEKVAVLLNRPYSHTAMEDFLILLDNEFEMEPECGHPDKCPVCGHPIGGA